MYLNEHHWLLQLFAITWQYWRHLAEGLAKGVMNYSFLHKATVEPLFFFPSCEPVMWAFSRPHTELQTCDYTSELTLLIFVKKSHSVAGRCVVTLTLSARSCDFYKIKNTCAVHVINSRGP